LVVEDDDEVRSLAVMMLTSLGYQVLEAEDGDTALNLLEDREGIDLLLTDVVLKGGLSGPELAGAVRHRGRGRKVLYMSGYTENAVLHQGRLDNGVVLLQKPFRKADLALKVRQALAQP
jgi:CheY-like chemotaxis protein